MTRLRRYGPGPALLATLAMVVLLPSCKVPGQQPGGGYTLTAYFSKAVSLYPKSSVRILGLNAGTVTSVKIQGDRVEVRMSMAKSAVLPRDVKATIVPQSLLGERYVQLYPAWIEGQPALDIKDKRQTVIGVDRTSIPVEPDEALAALKRLLDDLDPSATGRLVNNLSQDLQGNGQNLNDAVKGLGTVTNTLADKDKQLGNLIDNFANFTATLETRETQLGQVMDLFAQTTSLLAQERGTIATLIHNLSDTAANALTLVSKHGRALETDVSTLTRLLASLNANLDAVSNVLSAPPVLVAGLNLDSRSGLIAAYDPKYHRIDLRAQLTPTVQALLNALGFPVCASAPGSGTQANCPGAVSTAPPASGGPPASPGAPGATTPTTLPLPLPCLPVPTTTTTPGATTTTTIPPCVPIPTTLPPVTIPPVPTLPTLPPVTIPAPRSAPAAQAGLPGITVSPLSPIMTLLGSPGATGPIAPVAYGLTPEPAASPRHGVIGRLAQWSHDLLASLW